MKLVATLLVLAAPGGAHRLDEYLQATMFSVARDHIEAQIRLAPGVAVFPVVMASIGDDRKAYAERVLRDLSVTMDGVRLRPTLVSVKFPQMDEMKEGLGEIQIDFRASVPAGGPNRTLVFENHHLAPIAVYLVNALVPRDPAIHVVAQTRNENQSTYRLDYVQDGASPLSGEQAIIAVAALLILACFAYPASRWTLSIKARMRS
jgi:hypothetical protein